MLVYLNIVTLIKCFIPRQLVLCLDNLARSRYYYLDKFAGATVLRHQPCGVFCLLTNQRIFFVIFEGHTDRGTDIGIKVPKQGLEYIIFITKSIVKHNQGGGWSNLQRHIIERMPTWKFLISSSWKMAA